VTEVLAPAKLNLALVVGPRRSDGRHEVVTVLQRITLADRISLEPADRLRVDGFPDDTLVRQALEQLAAAAGVRPGWRIRIDKQIPVAAGLGGGSSDAAAALRLANDSLDRPVSEEHLYAVAAALGADVPFFLTSGPQLGEADGTRLTPLDLPQDYWILVFLPHGERKASTGAVYEEFDRRGGEAGFDERRAVLLEALIRGDLAALPPNDLASSPVGGELLRLGAFRADVTGAGPAVYGLFADESQAVAAHAALAAEGDVWVAGPAW
jgi:4-diphosphocytidyl-2-C-methyl-D-erythritol kinase